MVVLTCVGVHVTWWRERIVLFTDSTKAWAEGYKLSSPVGLRQGLQVNVFEVAMYMGKKQ